MTKEGTEQCAKCGACTAVCPVYRLSGREYHAGRGKLHLLARLDPARASAAYADILSRCLLCGACSAACSRGLPVARQLAEARQQLSRQAGEQALMRRLSHGLLEHPGLFRGLAPIIRRLALSQIPAASGLRLRLGAGAVDDEAGRQEQPEPVSQSAKDNSKGPANPGNEPPTRVGNSSLTDHKSHGASGHEAPQAVPPADRLPGHLFGGCYANHLDPAVGQAAATLLARADLPAPQSATDAGCCGLAAYSSGRGNQARELARRNIAAHPGTGPIVVTCASCAAHLRHYPQLLADDEHWRQPAADFAARIREFSQFLQEAGSKLPQPANAGPSGNGQPWKVFYHDPCHLRFDLKITTPPRQLLQAQPGAKLVELPGGPRCCGQGGLFHLAYPAEAATILEQLAAEFNQCGAELVTTTCSGCLLHWQRAAHQGLHKSRVIHLAVLLEQLTRT